MVSVNKFVVLLALCGLAALFSCTSSSGKRIKADPRFAPEKKELLKQQAEVAANKVKLAVTYAYDCAETFNQSNAQVLEIREYDEQGKMTSDQERFFNGARKKKTRYFYDRKGNKTHQELYDADDKLLQKKYFNLLGYDTLISNFLPDGTPRSSTQKFIEYTPNGFVNTIQEMDHMGRTHSMLGFTYNDTLLVEQELNNFNPLTGNSVGTEIIKFNDKGDRIYMSTASGSTIDDEVNMAYKYNANGKIENARLYDKNGLLIREKNNTFFENGSVKTITDTFFDPATATITQVYEEKYLDNGKLASYQLQAADGGLLRSGEYSYDNKGLLVETVEFDPGQVPAHLCTKLAYEYY